MPPVAQDQTAGSRHDKFLSICEAVMSAPDGMFREAERDFCETMGSRLADYGPRTYTSVAQINWLNRLERKCEEEGLL